MPEQVEVQEGKSSVLREDKREQQERLRRFGEILKWMRTDRGLSLREMGELLGISHQTVATMEDGRRTGDTRFAEPPARVLIRLSEVFSIPLPIITELAWGVRMELVEGSGKPVDTRHLKVFQKLGELAAELEKLVGAGGIELLTDVDMELDNWLCRFRCDPDKTALN